MQTSLLPVNNSSIWYHLPENVTAGKNYTNFSACIIKKNKSFPKIYSIFLSIFSSFFFFFSLMLVLIFTARKKDSPPLWLHVHISLYPCQEGGPPISIYSLYVGKTLWLSAIPTLHPAGIVSVDAQLSVDPCQEGGQPGYVLQDDGLEHK